MMVESWSLYAIRELRDIEEDMESPFEKMAGEMGPSGMSQVAVRKKR